MTGQIERIQRRWWSTSPLPSVMTYGVWVHISYQCNHDLVSCRWFKGFSYSFLPRRWVIATIRCCFYIVFGFTRRQEWILLWHTEDGEEVAEDTWCMYSLYAFFVFVCATASPHEHSAHLPTPYNQKHVKVPRYYWQSSRYTQKICGGRKQGDTRHCRLHLILAHFLGKFLSTAEEHSCVSLAFSSTLPSHLRNSLREYLKNYATPFVRCIPLLQLHRFNYQLRSLLRSSVIK